MNEFEIKALQHDLKKYGVIDITKITDEYNYREYGEIVFNIIIKYEYKGSYYHTDCLFEETPELSEKEAIKQSIKDNKRTIELQLYSKKKVYEGSLVFFSGVVNNQMEMNLVKNRIRISEEGFSKLSSEMVKVIQEGMDSKKDNLEIYKEVMSKFEEEYLNESV